MKLQFDAKQAYQIDEVSAIVDLFDGQLLNKPGRAPKVNVRVGERATCGGVGTRRFPTLGAENLRAHDSASET